MPRSKANKASLENLGVKVEPSLKRAIEDEGKALGIAPGTYSRQLVVLGWQARHNAPVSKNPREQMLINLFNELSVEDQERVLAIVQALQRQADNIPTQSINKTISLNHTTDASLNDRSNKKGGRK
jgi:hypothetical protein